jgi:hypothetical protein
MKRLNLKLPVPSWFSRPAGKRGDLGSTESLEQCDASSVRSYRVQSLGPLSDRRNFSCGQLREWDRLVEQSPLDPPTADSFAAAPKMLDMCH